MSPAAALESSVFRFYSALLLGGLLLAGVLLASLRWGMKKNVDHAWKSYCGWLIMVPLTLVMIFLGRVPTIVYLTTLSIFGFKEFARATGLYRDWFMTGAVYLAIIGVGLSTLAIDPANGHPGWYGVFMAFPVYAIAGILLVPILRNVVQGQLQAIALSIVGIVS